MSKKPKPVATETRTEEGPFEEAIRRRTQTRDAERARKQQQRRELLDAYNSRGT